LSSGTWVSVGPLRAQFIDHFAPYVRDVVFARADRDDIVALVFPDLEACRKLGAELRKDAGAAEVLAHEAVRLAFAERLRQLAASNTGSSTRVCRVLLMDQLPSMDSGEMTDKGSINQRAVIKNRAVLVDELYALPLSSRVISI